jgi:hypothetical protein
MGNIVLHAFIKKVRESRRLLYGDLQRLQRDVLPNGLTTREEAKALIALDGVLERADDGWQDYLTEALKQFVLSTSRPQGSVDHDTAEWLASALAGLPSKVAGDMVREVAKAARHADLALLDFVRKGSRRKPKARAARACRRAPDPTVSSWPEPAYEWGPISITMGDGSTQVETPFGRSRMELDRDG